MSSVPFLMVVRRGVPVACDRFVLRVASRIPGNPAALLRLSLAESGAVPHPATPSTVLASSLGDPIRRASQSKPNPAMVPRWSKKCGRQRLTKAIARVRRKGQPARHLVRRSAWRDTNAPDREHTRRNDSARDARFFPKSGSLPGNIGRELGPESGPVIPPSAGSLSSECGWSLSTKPIRVVRCGRRVQQGSPNIAGDRGWRRKRFPGCCLAG